MLERRFYGLHSEFWEPVAVSAGVECALLSLGGIQGFSLWASQWLPDGCRTLWECQSLGHHTRVAIKGIIKIREQLMPRGTTCISLCPQLAQATSLFPPPACTVAKATQASFPALLSLPPSFPFSLPGLPHPAQLNPCQPPQGTGTQTLKLATESSGLPLSVPQLVSGLPSVF